jgi:hypothetical protein
MAPTERRQRRVLRIAVATGITGITGMRALDQFHQRQRCRLAMYSPAAITASASTRSWKSVTI